MQELLTSAALAAELPDSPQTVISAHLLRRGLCRAWKHRAPGGYSVAIVQANYAREEPVGFGHHAETLAELLLVVPDWNCINVAASVAPELGDLIRQRHGKPVWFYRDLYFLLDRTPKALPHPHVRLLEPADLPLIEAAPRELHGAGFGSPGAMLQEGLVSGGIVAGQLVAIAHVSAFSEGFADIGAATLEPWRGQGLAAAAAGLVAQRIREGGRQAVWSTGERNYASLRVAEKLGFRGVGERVYVMLYAPG